MHPTTATARAAALLVAEAHLLSELLAAAEGNLEGYRKNGNARAISAGLVMVNGMRADLAEILTEKLAADRAQLAQWEGQLPALAMDPHRGHRAKVAINRRRLEIKETAQRIRELEPLAA